MGRLQLGSGRFRVQAAPGDAAYPSGARLYGGHAVLELDNVETGWEAARHALRVVEDLRCDHQVHGDVSVRLMGHTAFGEVCTVLLSGAGASAWLAREVASRLLGESAGVAS